LLKRSLSSAIAVAVAILLLAAGVVLIYQRGGVLAWLGLLLGAGLLLKFWIRPSKWDLPLGLTISTVWTLAWAAIFYYVISTWETGEVVELTIETPSGGHTARTWILEEPNALMLYYDAPTQAADALISGAPIAVMRGSEPLSFKQYTAVRVDDMPGDEINKLLDLMSKKYGERNAATDIFYRFLGRSRDKIGVVVEIPRGTNEQ
jgi:hypothetical protein